MSENKNKKIKSLDNKMKMTDINLPKENRSFVFTNYKIDTDYASIVENGSQIRYIAYGNEVCPTTGRPHHQGWMYYHNNHATSKTSCIKLSRVFADYTEKEVEDWFAEQTAGMCANDEKKFRKEHKAGRHCAYVYGMKGSLAQNDAYCSKEGELITFGDKPAQGSRGDLKDVVDKLIAGKTTVDDICLDDPLFFHQYGRTLDRVEDIVARKRRRTWETEGLWLFGETLTGKSEEAMAGFDPKTHYVKCLEEPKYWEGYCGQETVILNDFRGQLAPSVLYTLVDRYAMDVPRKGRGVYPFLAKKVIITSSLPPWKVYKNAVMDKSDKLRQCYRRFTIQEKRVDYKTRTYTIEECEREDALCKNTSTVVMRDMPYNGIVEAPL